jgi:hypothetical protein
MLGDPRSPAAFNAWDFLRKLYGVTGIKQAFDGVAPHPYGPKIEDVGNQVKKLRRVMKRNGDAGTGLWVTEIGWGSADTPSPLTKGSNGQAKMLKQSFSLLKSHKGWNVKSVLWYSHYDPRPAPPNCPWCDTAGLLDAKLKPKPSWSAFRSFAG